MYFLRLVFSCAYSKVFVETWRCDFDETKPNGCFHCSANLPLQADGTGKKGITAVASWPAEKAEIGIQRARLV